MLIFTNNNAKIRENYRLSRRGSLESCEMWLWIFRNCDDVAQERFSQNDTDIKKFNSKMCSACLKLHDINVPDKLADERAAVKSHKESMSKRTKYSKKITLKPLLLSSFRLAAQTMTSNESSIDNIKIHIKQCLNSLNHADKLSKKSLTLKKINQHG